jgi:hypothetical protein
LRAINLRLARTTTVVATAEPVCERKPDEFRRPPEGSQPLAQRHGLLDAVKLRLGRLPNRVLLRDPALFGEFRDQSRCAVFLDV